VRPGSPGPKPPQRQRIPERAPNHKPQVLLFRPTTATTDDNGGIATGIEMSPLASCVGLACMATLVTTRRSPSDGSAAHVRPNKGSSGASTQRHPIATRPPHVDDHDAATNAVATVFARIVADRYPGTSWLPVKSSRSEDRVVVPAGKILRLLPGPADMDTGSGIGHPAPPTTH